MSELPVIGVVGLGVMGLGIAQLFAQAGHQVLATDQQEALRNSATARLNDALAARVKAGKMNDANRRVVLGNLLTMPDLGGMRSAALVIEAIVEDVKAKQNLFEALENIVEPDTILASNTSSLSIGALARGLAHPQRFLGLHFFNPAPVMKLVEIIPHAKTAAKALALTRQITEATGKTVITSADRPGFIVNRCARPFYGEALALMEEGRSASDIDAAMVQAGYRLGPLSVIDLVGADINLAATQGLSQAMDNHPRYHVFGPLVKRVASGDLGKKSGKGFLFPNQPGPPPADAEKIVLRIQAALANEAASLLAEGVCSEGDIDTALKLGLNFPRGPFEAARALGFDRIRSTLATLEAAAPAHLKGRYTLSSALESLT